MRLVCANTCGVAQEPERVESEPILATDEDFVGEQPETPMHKAQECAPRAALAPLFA